MLGEHMEDALVDIIERHVRNGLQAAAEAGATAERERLMATVCSICGHPESDPLPHCTHGGERAGLSFFSPVAYAEFLCLHPEAGEGG